MERKSWHDVVARTAGVLFIVIVFLLVLVKGC